LIVCGTTQERAMSDRDDDRRRRYAWSGMLIGILGGLGAVVGFLIAETGGIAGGIVVGAALAVIAGALVNLWGGGS
jgi:zinc transporter ZupT